MTTSPHGTTIPPGYMQDAKGRLVPEALVKPAELLEDQTVRKILRYAEELSAQIGRFKGHAFDDVATFMEVLAEQYGASRGGQRGNTTLTSYDGCMKVQIAVADQISFGPELQVAKRLVDECITGWAEGSRDEIRALVDTAFQVDKEGAINREAILRLRRLQIDDPVWQQAMAALTDSIRSVGSKTYMRFYRRPSPQDAWQPVSIDLAAVAPASAAA